MLSDSPLRSPHQIDQTLRFGLTHLYTPFLAWEMKAPDDEGKGYMEITMPYFFTLHAHFAVKNWNELALQRCRIIH
jgi:hypothetical protein